MDTLRLRDGNRQLLPVTGKYRFSAADSLHPIQLHPDTHVSLTSQPQLQGLGAMEIEILEANLGDGLDIGNVMDRPLRVVRMIVIPAVAILLLMVLPSSMNDLKFALLIASACPVGSNVAVYAQLHNRDYTYAVETVVISTLLCVITLPLVTGVAGILLS